MGRQPEQTREMNPEEFTKITAIVLHSQIKLAVAHRYPAFTSKDHDRLMLDIINRMARLRGYKLSIVEGS